MSLTDEQIKAMCCEWVYVAPGREFQEYVPFGRAIESATAAPLLERIKELEAKCEKLKIEAQVHAQEATTANATIAEIYQLCTGSTGEPGNWHGASPVRQHIAELEQQLALAQSSLEAARKDAERYRWLRDRTEWEPFDSKWLNANDIYGCPTLAMDVAIDAAISKEQRG